MEDLIINDEIKYDEVRLLRDNDSPRIVSKKEALDLADEQDLDLIQIAVSNGVPVCRIADADKYYYEKSQKEKKKEKDMRKHQSIKEIIITPNIGDNDVAFKVKNAKKMLSHGDKVKLTMKMKGRELTHSEIYEEKLLSVAEMLSDVGKCKGNITVSGYTVFVTVEPKKKQPAAKNPSH